MQYQSHWQASAAAMDSAVEGNRQIAAEIGRAAKRQFHAVVEWLIATYRDMPEPRSLPPV